MAFHPQYTTYIEYYHASEPPFSRFRATVFTLQSHRFHASEPPFSRFRVTVFTLQSIPTLDVGLAHVRQRTQEEIFPSEAMAWPGNRRFPGLCQSRSWNKQHLNLGRSVRTHVRQGSNALYAVKADLTKAENAMEIHTVAQGGENRRGRVSKEPFT